MFQGDEQLVEMWLSFLYHNHWSTKQEYLKWIVMGKEIEEHQTEQDRTIKRLITGS